MYYLYMAGMTQLYCCIYVDGTTLSYVCIVNSSDTFVGLLYTTTLSVDIALQKVRHIRYVGDIHVRGAYL